MENRTGAFVTNGLLLVYPFLVHAAIVTGSAMLVFIALLVLALNVLAPWLVRRRVWAWMTLVLVCAASVMFVRTGDARLFLYAAPVLMALAMLWLFARTLLPGQVALITRIADAIRGPLPEPVRVYTRHVTQVWVAAFALMAIANLLLARYASPVTWSVFANFINYLLVAALFVAEWLFRCRTMRDYESLTWRQYMRALSRLDYRRLLA